MGKWAFGNRGCGFPAARRRAGGSCKGGTEKPTRKTGAWDALKSPQQVKPNALRLAGLYSQHAFSGDSRVEDKSERVAPPDESSAHPTLGTMGAGPSARSIALVFFD